MSWSDPSQHHTVSLPANASVVSSHDSIHSSEEYPSEFSSLAGKVHVFFPLQPAFPSHEGFSAAQPQAPPPYEARVTGYEPGKGKNKGLTGSLKCVMESGKKFNVGTGLSDKQRKNPPRVVSIIVYRFQELTRDGVPRFPSFIGEAADKTDPKDAEVPEHRKAGVAGPSDL
ncbi:DNA ligase OB-like domain-containing protein [Gautieria morchelliformis]|nr:DNA ligase OB-like domain-containing protein [Gautieria morchelliformis]